MQSDARADMPRGFRVPLRAGRGVRRGRRQGCVLPHADDLHQGLQPGVRLRWPYVSQHLRGALTRGVTAIDWRVPRRSSRRSGHLRARRVHGAVHRPAILPVHRSVLLWRGGNPRRVCRQPHRLHQRVGPRVWMRRQKLQQRLCRPFTRGVDPASWALPRRFCDSCRGRWGGVRGGERGALRHRALLRLRAGRALRGSQAARQVQGPRPSLHGGLQPGVRV